MIHSSAQVIIRKCNIWEILHVGEDFPFECFQVCVNLFSDMLKISMNTRILRFATNVHGSSWLTQKRLLLYFWSSYLQFTKRFSTSLDYTPYYIQFSFYWITSEASRPFTTIHKSTFNYDNETTMTFPSVIWMSFLQVISLVLLLTYFWLSR